MLEQLKEHRQKIDDLDQQWLEILSERFKVTHQVGELKASAGTSPY